MRERRYRNGICQADFVAVHAEILIAPHALLVPLADPAGLPVRSASAKRDYEGNRVNEETHLMNGKGSTIRGCGTESERTKN
jgi:hypothetical protein